MRKNCLTAVAGLCLALLAGCQTLSSPSEIFSPGHADQNLSASVHNAFMNNPELSAVPIHVETQKGVVVLSGYVKTIRQSDTAGYIASKVPGVKSVQNGLIVRK
ncbi:periplasmic protein [Legionella massiliensis]|uniref:Periplasmic protein n=1 Tax=Legionella massiliensis TaxID=1034943 RepID=A0A078L0G0_9GAMM|nr:BON domain-containing protein [Legionella massiliensis]CDZ77534.1 periplasmic protein [Legionella massiliensis]CEE13272.1 periplasmic protein [Legionella massiliensis]